MEDLAAEGSGSQPGDGGALGMQCGGGGGGRQGALETTAQAAYKPAAQEKVDHSTRRQDIILKYGKYGTSQVARGEDGGCFATTAQCSFPSRPAAANPEPGSAAAALPPKGDPPAPSLSKIQQCLWSGSKFVDSQVPRTLGECQAAAAREAKLKQEAAKSAYTTVEKVSGNV